jgi:hypothetical protein
VAREDNRHSEALAEESQYLVANILTIAMAKQARHDRARSTSSPVGEDAVVLTLQATNAGRGFIPLGKSLAILNLIQYLSNMVKLVLIDSVSSME